MIEEVLRYRRISKKLNQWGIRSFGRTNQWHSINFQEYFETTYKCNFEYSGCAVNFEFQQGKLIKKEFIFTVNEREFIRAQKESFNDYQVFS